MPPVIDLPTSWWYSQIGSMKSLLGPTALGAERVQALAPVPAVVAALLDEVDLLVQVLADVAGPELAGLAVERHPPDVAQAIGLDLRPRVLRADERVVLRDGVVLAVVLVIDVDAQDLAEQRLRGSGRCRSGRWPSPPSPWAM